MVTHLSASIRQSILLISICRYLLSSCSIGRCLRWRRVSTDFLPCWRWPRECGFSALRCVLAIPQPRHSKFPNRPFVKPVNGKLFAFCTHVLHLYSTFRSGRWNGSQSSHVDVVFAWWNTKNLKDIEPSSLAWATCYVPSAEWQCYNSWHQTWIKNCRYWQENCYEGVSSYCKNELRESYPDATSLRSCWHVYNVKWERIQSLRSLFRVEQMPFYEAGTNGFPRVCL